jgi:hypothetical protein
LGEFALFQPLPHGLGYAEQINKLAIPKPEKSLDYQTFKVLMLRITLPTERAAVKRHFFLLKPTTHLVNRLNKAASIIIHSGFLQNGLSTKPIRRNPIIYSKN